jgi:hypothetical protein
MITGHCAINILADLFPARTIVLKTANPDMTPILSILSIVGGSANRYRLAIARDGHRPPELIPERFTNYVLADLLTRAGASSVAAG